MVGDVNVFHDLRVFVLMLNELPCLYRSLICNTIRATLCLIAPSPNVISNESNHLKYRSGPETIGKTIEVAIRLRQTADHDDDDDDDHQKDDHGDEDDDADDDGEDDKDDKLIIFTIVVVVIVIIIVIIGIIKLLIIVARIITSATASTIVNIIITLTNSIQNSESKWTRILTNRDLGIFADVCPQTLIFSIETIVFSNGKIPDGKT